VSYEIVIDHDNQIIIVHVSGRETLEEHMHICEKAVQNCFDNGFKRLLIDLRALDTANITSAEAGVEFGKFFAGDKRFKDIRIAQVLPKEMLVRVDVDFSASIAEIKGKTIGRFTTLEDARGWLKDQEILES